MRCEFERDVSIYLRGALPASERARFVAHLVDCGSCAAFVASDQRHFGANPDRPPRREVPATESPAPSRVGRYIVLNLVGRGGMGDVYAAYDPRLDRKVALKLLRETPGDGPTVAAAQERLLREAQATARLSHHNVVVVYDAGTFEQDGGGSRVYLAMELVQGRTLSAWLGEERRSWRQIRDLFLAAGEGLQAAHEAGLVHRDFKPQNVMVDRDGTVRVMDFGLAGDASEMPAGDRTAIDATSEGSPTAETMALTHTGVLLGTPVYMAPEQFTGRPTDARTDQFSFCVALYEALYGERPFPSETYTALVGAVVAGRVREPPRGARVPGFLRKVLLRGLSAEPEERYRSMRELLSALSADPIRYRRGVATGAAVAAVTFAVMVGTHALADRKQRMCRAGADKLQGTWETDGTGPRRVAVHASFVASGSAIAEDTWHRASALLDDYSRRWTAAYTDTCEATHMRGDQSTEVLDLRMACLDRERGAVRALTDVFSRADTRTVIEAVNAVNALPPIEQCADVAQLRAVVPRPTDPAARARVVDVEAQLAEVTALTDTGSWQSAYSRVQPLVGAARAAGYEPLLAEVLGIQGWLAMELGHWEQTRRSYEEAMAVALATHQDDLAARAAAQMIFASLRDSREENEQWVALAAALAQRLGSGHERTVAWFHQNKAIALERRGNFQGCATEFSLALSLKRKVLPPNHPDIAISLGTTAALRAEMNDGESALAAAQESLDIYRRAYGNENPNLSSLLEDRGMAFRALRRYAEAENDFRSAVTFYTTLVGADNVWVSSPLHNLGEVLVDEGKLREAVPVLETAIQILERADPMAPELSESRFALACARWGLHRDGAADLAMARAALGAYRAAPGLKTRIDEMEAWLADKPPGRSGGRRVFGRAAKPRSGATE